MLFSIFRPALFLLLSVVCFILFYLNLTAWVDRLISGIDSSTPYESEPYEVFNAVFSLHNQLWVQVDMLCSPGMYNSSDCETKTGLYRVSNDGGNTWTNQEAPQGRARATGQACVPGHPLTCYRLYGGDRILVSQTGGWLWRREWELNLADRRAYFPLPSQIFPDGLRNLAILTSETGYRVVVAHGNQGLLIRREDGTWLRSMEDITMPVDSAPALQGIIDRSPWIILDLFVSGISYVFFFIASLWNRSTLSRHKFSRSSAAAFFAALALPLPIPGMLLLPLWLLEWGLFPHPILIAFAAFLVLAVYIALLIYLPRKM